MKLLFYKNKGDKIQKIEDNQVKTRTYSVFSEYEMGEKE